MKYQIQPQDGCFLQYSQTLSAELLAKWLHCFLKSALISTTATSWQRVYPGISEMTACIGNAYVMAVTNSVQPSWGSELYSVQSALLDHGPIDIHGYHRLFYMLLLLHLCICFPSLSLGAVQLWQLGININAVHFSTQGPYLFLHVLLPFHSVLYKFLAVDMMTV